MRWPMHFGTKAPIALRMSAAVTLPIVAMIVLAAATVAPEWQTASQMGRLQDLTQFATELLDAS